jgi:hypothetical protein
VVRAAVGADAMVAVGGAAVGGSVIVAVGGAGVEAGAIVAVGGAVCTQAVARNEKDNSRGSSR